MEDYLSLSEQLNILFDAIRPSEEHPYTLQEVSNATGISLATISQMRTGRIKNPQLNTLRAVCRFFNIPLRYFETRTPEECYAILTERNSEDRASLNEIAFRASGLSTRSQRDILTIIKWVQAAEQNGEGVELPPLSNLEDDEDEPQNGD